jgi:hypothetical protein
MTPVRARPVVACVLVGVLFTGLAIVADICWDWDNILPSVFLEIGTGFALVAAGFMLQRVFVRTAESAAREVGREVAEDVVESIGSDSGSLAIDSENHIHPGIDRVTIDVLPTSTEGGRQPKVLVRVTDPDGDYKTSWVVTINFPDGREMKQKAFWPASGPVFRARFPTGDDRQGTWSGVAIRTREGTVTEHSFTKTL